MRILPTKVMSSVPAYHAVFLLQCSVLNAHKSYLLFAREFRHQLGPLRVGDSQLYRPSYFIKLFCEPRSIRNHLSWVSGDSFASNLFHWALAICFIGRLQLRK
jgi:hypothetical protein